MKAAFAGVVAGLLFFALACVPDEEQPPPRLAMKCIRVGKTPSGISVHRCENEEALCYQSTESGLICVWKELE